MRRLRFLILALALLVWLLPSSMLAAPNDRQLAYTLEPLFHSDGLRFRVELSFRGDASGVTTLVLPNQWAGQKNLHQAIQNLRVVTRGAELAATAEAHLKRVRHRPNQKLRIRYELAQDFAGAPQNETRYRVILRRDYFHWIGHGAWVHADWPEDEPVRFSLRWKKLPQGWTLATSFGAARRRQDFHASLSAFRHAVFAGGDFRLQLVPVRGQAVYAAVRGIWSFPDSDFAALVQRIVEVEREFWQDFRSPYYLVTLLPLEAPPGSYSFGGTGLTDSFALFCTPNATLDDLKTLLAHEYFHNWNAQKLGTLQPPEPQLYWFSEGFTDYYAYLLLLRGGLLSLDDYLQKHNELLRDYYFLPVRADPNQRIVQDYWNDAEVQKLPYRRGLVLAANWNAEICRASGGRHSLDDAMRDLLQAAKPELTAADIAERVRRYGGRDVAPDIERYIERGELMAPVEGALGPHVEIALVEFPRFELGLDFHRLRAEKIIAGVQPGSAAYDAGLRDGQVVLRRSPIYLGDPAKPVEITIQDGAEERLHRYFPASREPVGVPQFALRPGSGERERAETLSWLGRAAAPCAR
ncbi:MAG TPA: hypothetical protein VNN18_09480 [Candidatus Xenobia bacterium]|nr:hypothetical protein [Candidatus Xenobia bacterium]